MLTLAINTAGSRESVALLELASSEHSEREGEAPIGLCPLEGATRAPIIESTGHTLLKEISWRGRRNETEKLLPAIEKLLARTRCNFDDIEKIIIVTGPGPFSSLRIGVTVANMLAHILRIPLYSLSVVPYWRHRVKRKGIDSALLLFSAGGMYNACIGRGRRITVDTMEHIVQSLPRNKTHSLSGDITEESRAFLKKARAHWRFFEEQAFASFGKTIASLPRSMLKKCPDNVAIPEYFRPPNITKPRS